MFDLTTYYHDHVQSIVELTTTLANIESPTNSKQHVDRLADFLEARLNTLGAAVQRIPRETVGDILLAKWNADRLGKPILFALHMDTVWPLGTLAARPVHVEGDVLIGPGTYDMKASHALVLTVIDTLRAHNLFPDRPIWVLFTSDEEIGSSESVAMIEEVAAQVGLALVMEFAAKNEGLKTWRKGVAHYTLTIAGRSSHAGNAPEKGINAVLEAAYQTIALSALAAPDKGTTVSVTVVHGGSAVNVIPDSAAVQIDVRFSSSAEAARVKAAILSPTITVPGATITTQIVSERPPMEHDAQMIATFAQAQAIAAQHGLTIGEDGSGGGSDGNFIAGLGIPTLDGLGAHGDGAHAQHEYCLIPSLARRAVLLSALICDWPPLY